MLHCQAAEQLNDQGDAQRRQHQEEGQESGIKQALLPQRPDVSLRKRQSRSGGTEPDQGKGQSSSLWLARHQP